MGKIAPNGKTKQVLTKGWQYRVHASRILRRLNGRISKLSDHQLLVVFLALELK